jgi:hypothetical protein
MLSGTTTRARPVDGPVLVRVEASDREWVVGLPPVPDGHRIGVTVGQQDAVDDTTPAALAERGYELLAVVGGRRPGRHADLLVPAPLRVEHERWFAALLLVSTRVFDLRFGPVHVALHDELKAHLPRIDDRL